MYVRETYPATALLTIDHSVQTMSQRKLALRGLLFLSLLGLSGLIHAWTDSAALETLQKRALFGGTACTLAAKYGYVRSFRDRDLSNYFRLELARCQWRQKTDVDSFGNIPILSLVLSRLLW
jgi:hypothetical protein